MSRVVWFGCKLFIILTGIICAAVQREYVWTPFWSIIFPFSLQIWCLCFFYRRTQNRPTLSKWGQSIYRKIVEYFFMKAVKDFRENYPTHPVSSIGWPGESPEETKKRQRKLTASKLTDEEIANLSKKKVKKPGPEIKKSLQLVRSVSDVDSSSDAEKASMGSSGEENINMTNPESIEKKTHMEKKGSEKEEEEEEVSTPQQIDQRIPKGLETHINIANIHTGKGGSDTSDSNEESTRL